jgi:hypothetical protein
VTKSEANMTFDTHAAFPGLVGCYAEPDCGDVYKRALNYIAGPSSSMTVEGCINEANARGYAHAALQAGEYCFGGNANISQLSFAGNCNARCSGNSGYICGGTCSNLIYLTGGLAWHRVW